MGVADLLRKSGLLYSERPAGLLRKGGRFSPKNADDTINQGGRPILKQFFKRFKPFNTKTNHGATSVCPVRDNKKAIVTFIADDGIYHSCVKYNEFFRQYGLKGTAALITDWVEKHYAYGDSGSPPDGANGAYCGTWKEWRELIDQGQMDIANHSFNHRDFAGIDPAVEPDELEKQINGARSTLLTKLKGIKVIGMVSPYNTKNAKAEAVIRQHHYAERSGVEGDNPLDPDDTAWYALNYRTADSGKSAGVMNAWVDDAIAGGRWCIEMWHGVDGEGWYPPSGETCGRHLAYLAGRLNDVWNATYNEAIQYIHERQNATVSVQNKAGRTDYTIKLTLPPEYKQFSYPLTLKTLLHEDWTGKATVIQDGKTRHAEPVIEGDNKYLIYNAVPNKGDIKIRRE
jgi:peptidoglycan/xylan/chitin deacetylase (PgdA/CDA1 family)